MLGLQNLRYLSFGKFSDLALLMARVSLMLLFIIFGVAKVLHFNGTIAYFQHLGLPLPVLATLIAILVEVFAAVCIAVGFYTRPLALVFVVYTIATAFISHHYWTFTGDAVQPNMINFYKNVSIAAACLLLFVLGPGKLSLDKR